MMNKIGIIKTKQKRPGNTHRHPIFAINANCSRKSNATLIETTGINSVFTANKRLKAC